MAEECNVHFANYRLVAAQSSFDNSPPKSKSKRATRGGGGGGSGDASATSGGGGRKRVRKEVRNLLDRSRSQVSGWT